MTILVSMVKLSMATVGFDGAVRLVSPTVTALTWDEWHFVAELPPKLPPGKACCPLELADCGAAWRRRAQARRVARGARRWPGVVLLASLPAGAVWQCGGGAGWRRGIGHWPNGGRRGGGGGGELGSVFARPRLGKHQWTRAGRRDPWASSGATADQGGAATEAPAR